RARIALADGRTLQAEELVVYPSADPLTHSVGVRVGLPDVAPAPLPGSTAKVLFPIATGDAAVITIPASAVVQRGELSGAYVVEGERVVLRQLRLGARAGGRVEVLAGLRAGETIAADPVAAVQALAARRAPPGAGRGWRTAPGPGRTPGRRVPGQPAASDPGLARAAARPGRRAGDPARGRAADRRHHGQRDRAVPGL